MKVKSLLITSLFLLLCIVPVMGQADETLTIAFIGSDSAHDQALYHAAQLAADEINALSGDDELRDAEDTVYELNIRFYEASNAREAVDAYADAEDDDAIAVLLADDRDLLDALEDDGALNIPVFHAIPDGASGNKYYRLVASYDTQAENLADYLVNERHFNNIAIAVADSTSAQNVSEAFADAVAAEGGEIVADTTHSVDSDDLRSDAEDIRESGAEAVLLWTFDSQALEMLEALEAEGWHGVIIYNQLDADFVAQAGDLAQGVLSPVTWTALAYDAASQNFSHDFVAEYDNQAVNSSAAYYDAVYMLGEAVRASGDNAATKLTTLGSYDGVQAVYNNAQAQDIFIVQAWGTSLIEQVRYENGACVNCLDTWRGEVDESTVDSRDSLLIALIVPNSDSTLALGENIENAVDLAVREINDLGGIVSENVQYSLVVRSYYANTPAETAVALQAAQADGAVVIMGLDSNALVLNNLALVAQTPLSQFVSATDARIPVLERSNNALQIRSNDSAIAEAVMTYLLDERDLEGIASIAVRTDYAREAQDAAEDILAESSDGRLELTLNYDLGTTDFTAIAAQIVGSNSEAVIIWSPAADASALLIALEAATWDGVFVYPYITAENLSLFDNDSIEVLGASNWWTRASDWASLNFSNAYFDNYGIAPLAQAVSYYDAVYWMATGIEVVGTDAAQLNTWLLDTESFTGVQGLYQAATFADGETIRSVFIGEVSEDTLQEIARYNSLNCLVGCN